MGDVLVGFVKFFLAIVLLPIVLACLYAFHKHLVIYPVVVQNFLLYGVGAFLITFLFVYQFWGVYEFGQKIMSGLFSFLAPVNRYASYVFPFYVIIIAISFFIVTSFFKTDSFNPHFLFFLGFFLGMNILCTAQDLQQQEQTRIKPSYLLTMGVVVIFNLILIVIILDVLFGKFTLTGFVNSTHQYSIANFKMALGKILLLK